MKWYEITVLTVNEAQEAVSELLVSLGAKGVAIENRLDLIKILRESIYGEYADKDLLLKAGDGVQIKAYYPEDTIISHVNNSIETGMNNISSYLETGAYKIINKLIDEEDWANGWKKYYKPFRITGNIIIKPSWETYVTVKGESVIEMEPGMAFGTGTHETTRLCSAMLEKYVKANDTVIDLGCGTGILALIALKLGASDIYAVDNDPVAVSSAIDNIAHNKAESRIKVLKGTIDELLNIKNNDHHLKCDILAANIIADIIIDISPKVPLILKDMSLLIVSGIIAERKNEITGTYTKSGFVLIDEEEENGWAAMTFRWPGSSQTAKKQNCLPGSQFTYQDAISGT